MFSIHSLKMDFFRDGSLQPVFRGIDFDVPKGQFLSIVGPSGCGKTTLLRCMAGLNTVTAGRIFFEGIQVTTPCCRVGMVFQDYGNSLFPWKTVLGNVLFAMSRIDGSAVQKMDIAKAHLSSVGLGGCCGQYPWELSGGMQQRLAIARALAGGAECLLMDEPFASIDAQTRTDLEDLLLRVWAAGGRTIVFVTHDVDEAIYLSDRVLVLGGEPASILDDITISLPRPRSQLTTRAEPRFSELRILIHEQLTSRVDR